jgi:hypothetical protein
VSRSMKHTFPVESWFVKLWQLSQKLSDRDLITCCSRTDEAVDDKESCQKFSRNYLIAYIINLAENKENLQSTHLEKRGQDASGCLFNIYHETMRVDPQGHS